MEDLHLGKGPAGIHPARIRILNGNPVPHGSYVLLWLQASVRASCNHALAYAVGRANELGKPAYTN